MSHDRRCTTKADSHGGKVHTGAKDLVSGPPTSDPMRNQYFVSTSDPVRPEQGHTCGAPPGGGRGRREFTGEAPKRVRAYRWHVEDPADDPESLAEAIAELERRCGSTARSLAVARLLGFMTVYGLRHTGLQVEFRRPRLQTAVVRRRALNPNRGCVNLDVALHLLRTWSWATIAGRLPSLISAVWLGGEISPLPPCSTQKYKSINTHL